ncbi:hypothetical protein O6H91_16G067800 [Diphasiastrum complanatum]|uniref:Uncharacterized protein n=1 Tax=Diphasiastrum complanatum TaxID=34168 RepID=A0ACC2BE48_DIPCM|nr:hypothetical protein O6H91_16G067800 [Diphasiastrum complanatum]
MSLLSYAQGMLSEELGVGTGLTEPWGAQCPFFLAWQDDEYLVSVDANLEYGGLGSGSEKFFSAVAEGAPAEELPDSGTLGTVRKDLHWDSPPQSPGSVSIHLPFSVLQIVAKSSKADAVVVGVMSKGWEKNLETLLHVPKDLEFPDMVECDMEDLVLASAGKVLSIEGRKFHTKFASSLGGEPQAFIFHPFCLEGYEAVLYALWLDSTKVPVTAEAIFLDASLSMPMLLSNRLNSRKYERLGRRFDAILKMMPQAVVFVDDEAGQVVVNPAAANLLSLPSHGEVDPVKIASAMRKLAKCSSTRTDPQRWFLNMSSQEDQNIEEEWELSTPRRVLHVRSYPVSSHAAHGCLWLYEDVTAEHDAREAIEAANRAKSQFLAMMSHELRTPMTGVLGMLDLLHLTKLLPEQQGLVKVMQESAEGLMQVINNILDFCKMEAGRLSLEDIEFSLLEIFDQVSCMHQQKLKEKNLQLSISGPKISRLIVCGDPVRLRQILINLVSNSIKFSESGTITIMWNHMKSAPASLPGQNIAAQVPAQGVDEENISQLHYDSMNIQFPVPSNSVETRIPTPVRKDATSSTPRLKICKFCGGFLEKEAYTYVNSYKEAAATDSGVSAIDKRIWLEVKVIDSGIGIAEEQLQLLFAGIQAGSPRRDTVGTGLGLAICNGLLGLMNGQLRIESTAGQGTMVTFVAPLLQAEDSSRLSFIFSGPDRTTEQGASKEHVLHPNQPNSNGDQSKSIRVLVAEDNKVNQLLIRKMFNHYGLQVELVGNGKLAVEAVQKETYDLVLMDLQMPILDGLSATKAIRGLNQPLSCIPIYALSADALAPECGPIEETGLNGYLSKPIVWEKMAEVIEKVLSKTLSN